MQIEVIKEQHNALLDRKELQIKIKHPGATPGRIEVKNKVAADLKVEPDLVIVDNMKTAFGTKETIAYIKVYESTEVAQQIEREHILKRNQSSSPEPAGEAEETATPEPAGEAEETATPEPAGEAEETATPEPTDGGEEN
jgi:small subunit ribosomal protein S24e